VTSERRRLFRVVFFAVVLAFVIAEIIVDPLSLTSDGVSYLDVGDAILGLKRYGIVGYFSPLFAIWIALAVRVTRPDMTHELLVVRAAAGVITLLAAVAFDALLSAVVDYVKQSAEDGGTRVRESYWLLWGYSVFLWNAVRNVGTAKVTPDMGVMALLFTAVALILRAANRPERTPSFRQAAILGLVLATGYLTKSVFFVYALILLSVFSLQMRRAPRTVATAWLFFLLGAAPWITALSLTKGRPTFGDAGRLNLTWFQSTVRFPMHWQGDEPGFGTPVHPTRRLLRAPEVFEFATPFPVSYGPWYDASYWYEGMRTKLDAREFVAQSWQRFKGTSPQLWLLAVAFIVLAVASRTMAPLRSAFGPLMVLIGPAVAAYAMYAPIAPEPRYLAGFVVLLYLFIFAAWSTWQRGAGARFTEPVMLAVAAILLFSTARVVQRHAAISVDANWKVHREDDGDIRTAATLRAAGYGPGTPMAGIGTPGAYAMWLRLGRFHEVAESPSGAAGSYWRSDAPTRARVIDLLRGAGARAVVSDSLPAGPLPAGWRRVPESRYAFCALTTGTPCD
jgi:hypothetical protein